MTPEEALQFIDRVRQNVTLSGKDHDAYRQAVMVLAGAIRIEAQAKKPSKPDPKLTVTN